MNSSGEPAEVSFGPQRASAAPPAEAGARAAVTEFVAQALDDQQLLVSERSRLLADRLGVGFWQRNVETGALDWDAQMFRIHGRDPALGAPRYETWIDACVHPLDRAWVGDRMRQIEADWAPVTDLCFRALQPDAQGGERWVQIWGRRLRLGGRRLCFGMHLDVTGHQRQQMQLAQERERTRYAIAAAEVGVWECGPDGRLCHANEVMHRQLGLDTEARATADPAALARLLRRLTDPEDWRRMQDRLRRRLASGEAFRHELPMRRGGTPPRWLALQGRALRGPDGRVCGMAGVQIDITERKQAEALQLERQRLAQASRDKSVFMARMSHELRTPMNAVLGFTRLLEDDPLEPPSPRQRERLARIAQAGDRLLALIDNLLDLARLDTADEPGPARPVALAELLREAAAAVTGEAERAGVRLQLPHGVPGHAYGDRSRLVQALGHVLLLVVQRCAAGAELVLEAGLEAGLEATGSAARPTTEPTTEPAADAGGPDCTAVLRIFDPALPVPGQPSLFDHTGSADGHGLTSGTSGTSGTSVSDTPNDSRFNQSLDTVFDHGLDTEPDAMAAVPAPGVDLGLSLALRLVQAVGGHIETRELDRTGAPAAAALRRVHVLRLPGLSRSRAQRWAPGAAWPLASASAAAVDPAGAPSAPALHVLCVEDNPVNLQLVREVFALRPRVRLSTAVDGMSGLAQALAEPPDLVLLDLQLPDMSGLDVLRRLRAQDSLSGCTVIALSADAMPEHIAAGRAAGFDDYWTKPIQFDRFLADIDRLAQARALR